MIWVRRFLKLREVFEVLSFEKNRILFPDGPVEFDYSIKDIYELSDKLLILFDPDSYTSKFGQFKNLIAVDLKGKELWVADLPTSNTGSHYYRLESADPLIAYSYCSYECVIDPANGKILSQKWFK